jgi:hypothetical protein
MEKFPRNAAAKTVQFIPIARPFSNFDFIENRFAGLNTLHRLMSQVRGNSGQTLVLEELEDSTATREENEDLKLCSDFVSSTVFRLSFFRAPFKTDARFRKLPNDSFLGYAVVKVDTFASGSRARIFEAVIVPARHDNNFVRGQQTWKVKVAGKQFQIEGYLYAQQNGITNCCAHVAVRTTAARFHPAGDMTYREMNALLKIDQKSRKGGDGLSNDEIVQLLEASGAKVIVGNFTDPNNPSVAPFQKFIYGSVESGYPAIIFFATSSGSAYHTIPVFGHTFNQDTWVPSADASYFKVGAATRYIPSEAWLSTFIAHDDNYGSNLCVPRHYLQTKQTAAQPGSTVAASDSVAYIIATVPKEVQIHPVQAEVIAADFLFSLIPQISTALPWARRLVEHCRADQLVLRPILVEKSKYVTHLAAASDWSKEKLENAWIDALTKYLPEEKLWLVELSVPELFSTNLRKVGEILLRAETAVDPTKRDFSSFILARLPGCFALYDQEEPGQPIFEFIDCKLKSHVDLFR